MLRRLQRLGVLTAIAAGMISVHVDAASAATCTVTTHCYGSAEWFVTAPSGFEGAQVSLRTNCMTVSDYTTQTIMNELWTVDATGSYWNEAGVRTGAKNGGTWTTTPTYVWADWRPNGSYNEHYFAGAVPLNTPVTVSIVESSNGSGTWNINVGGNTGTSTSNFAGPAEALETGTESQTDTGHSYGSSSAMSFYSTTRSLVSGWAASTHSGLSTPKGGTNVSWASTYDWIRDGQGATC